jgi:hypothetical protein
VTLDFTQVMAAFEGALWELEESEFEADFDGETKQKPFKHQNIVLINVRETLCDDLPALATTCRFVLADI